MTYWIDRAHWGRGIASAALALLLAEVSERPIRARAASDNAASRRIHEKSGFVRIGSEVSYAPGRGRAIQESIFELRAESARQRVIDLAHEARDGDCATRADEARTGTRTDRRNRATDSPR